MIDAASSATPTPIPTGAPATPGLPIAACVAIGVGAAVLGLVPWLVTGMRLPVQNLWAADDGPGSMPLVLLPFSQYALTLLGAVLVVGGAAAGLAARAVRDRLPGRRFLAVLLGLLLVQAAAVVQTSLVVLNGLQVRRESTVYLTVLTGVAVLAVAIGVLAAVLVARAPRAGALIGLGVAALATGPWLSGLVVPFGSVPGTGVTTALSVVRWVPAVLVGAAVAWAGIGSVGRAVATLVDLVALWLVPALLTGVSSATGSRVLAPYPAEMVAYAREVFVAAATGPGLVVGPLVVAAAVAGVGLLVRRALPTAGRGAVAPR